MDSKTGTLESEIGLLFDELKLLGLQAGRERCSQHGSSYSGQCSGLDHRIVLAIYPISLEIDRFHSFLFILSMELISESKYNFARGLIFLMLNAA